MKINLVQNIYGKISEFHETASKSSVKRIASVTGAVLLSVALPQYINSFFGVKNAYGIEKPKKISEKKTKNLLELTVNYYNPTKSELKEASQGIYRPGIKEKEKFYELTFPLSQTLQQVAKKVSNPTYELKLNCNGYRSETETLKGKNIVVNFPKECVDKKGLAKLSLGVRGTYAGQKNNPIAFSYIQVEAKKQSKEEVLEKGKKTAQTIVKEVEEVAKIEKAKSETMNTRLIPKNVWDVKSEAPLEFIGGFIGNNASRGFQVGVQKNPYAFGMTFENTNEKNLKSINLPLSGTRIARGSIDQVNKRSMGFFGEYHFHEPIISNLNLFIGAGLNNYTWTERTQERIMNGSEILKTNTDERTKSKWSPEFHVGLGGKNFQGFIGYNLHNKKGFIGVRGKFGGNKKSSKLKKKFNKVRK